MTTDLPTLYAAVCAKRPELAVPSLTVDTNPPGWSLCGSWCGEHFAAALILSRWVEALPTRCSLHHLEADHARPEEWQVRNLNQSEWLRIPYAPTPLEALAAFYLGETA